VAGAVREVLARARERVLSRDAFLDQVYRELLGREPDLEARVHYRGLLGRGMARSDLVMTIAKSDEFAQRVGAMYPIHTVEHTYSGVPLRLCIADSMGSDWYDVDWPVRPDVALLGGHRLAPGATVFDLGAHQGVYALILANAVGPRGRVVAVEANASNAGLVEVNRCLNGADNVTAILAAAAERSGSIGFGRGGNGQVDGDGITHDDAVQVRAVTIDELAGTYGPPDVLFIDVEGYECHVLRGGSAAMARRPDCFIEVHVGVGLEMFGGSVESLLAFFPVADYDLYVSNERDRTPRPLTDETRAITGKHFYLTAIARR
jgi:FkbM family methyltransferase